jgi:aspartate-semialdehyde dehydrogenase
LTGPRPSWLFAAGAEASAAYVEEATNAGCLVIDLSGLFALEPDVPLVVPDVNPFVLGDYRNRNLIAVPNSLTSQLLTALAAYRSGRTVAH